MLITRVITAIVLIIVLVLTALVPQSPLYFALLMSLAAALCIWEILRLGIRKGHFGAASTESTDFEVSANTGFAGFFVRHVAVLVAVLSFCGLLTLSFLVYKTPTASDAMTNAFNAHVLMPFFLVLSWIIGALWLCVPLLFVFKKALNNRWFKFILSIVICLSVVVAWYTVLQSYTSRNFWYLLSWMMLIWVADIGAYFGGRHFQGPKLAPQISPGKTWSGAICGVAAAAFWLLLSGAFFHSFTWYLVNQKDELYQAGMWGFTLFAGVFLGIWTIVGDLLESLIKRHGGMKDSSRLLPGHGGIWDRFDSILAVAPFIFLIWFFTVGY